MDADDDHTHEHQPNSVPPHGLPPFINPFTGANIPASMSGENGQPDLFGFIEFTSLPTQLHSHAPPIGPTSQSLSHTNPAFFPSGTPGPLSRLAIHGTDPQMTPGHLDQSFLSARTLPAHSPFWSPHTRHSSFPEQYVMPSHPHALQNQLSQPYMYQRHHLSEFSPYPPPTQYFPFPRQQSLPSVQVHRPSLRMPPSSISSPGPSRVGPSYGVQQYLPSPYGSTSHFAFPRRYQPSVFPWHYGPGSSPDIFNVNIPPQVQHLPMNYPHSTQRMREDSNTLREQSTASEPLHSPCPRPSRHPITDTTSRASVSPTAVGQPEQLSTRDSLTHELGNKESSHAHLTHRHPHIRHQYHPNPPSNRSEWVMWMGNVPSDATHDELQQFLQQSPTVSSGSEGGSVEDSGVLSIFLISRSNCAFVNYRSEQHLNHAISQFNGHKLRVKDRRCPRLVCRARRKEDDLRAGVGAQRGMGVHIHFVKSVLSKSTKRPAQRATLDKGRSRLDPATRGDPLPTSASGDNETPKSEEATGEASTQTPSSYASTTSSFFALHFPRRFFILKSRTQSDLDLGVHRNAWATQKHNEAVLDQAFRTSKEVILIFSANKSGEFYGYARMTSGILQNSPTVKWTPSVDPSPSTSSHSPSSVPVHGAPERGEGSHHSSKHLLAEASPPEDCSVASLPHVKFKSIQERRSAPPAVHREDLISADLPPRSSFSCGNRGSDVTFRDSLSSALQSESDMNPELLAKERNKGGDVDASGGLGLHLPPLVEETHGVEDVPQDSSITIPPIAMHDHAEVQQREPEPNWGETFRVEWLSTARISFRRTRHLRNPWNHDREIKLSRDGTELEPLVGQQLVEEWPMLANESANDDSRRTAGLGSSDTNRVAMQSTSPRGNRSRPGRILMNVRHRGYPQQTT